MPITVLRNTEVNTELINKRAEQGERTAHRLPNLILMRLKCVRGRDIEHADLSKRKTRFKVTNRKAAV